MKTLCFIISLEITFLSKGYIWIAWSLVAYTSLRFKSVMIFDIWGKAKTGGRQDQTLKGGQFLQGKDSILAQ